MKKYLIPSVIVIFVIGLWWYAEHRGNTATVVNLHPVTTSHVDPSNATFTIDNQPVALKDGKAVIPAGPAGVTAEVDLTNVVGYGDLNNDGHEDAVVVLVESGAGSGVFLDVAAYVSGPVEYKGTNAAFIGDRVDPQSVSIKGDTITVTYLDRAPGEPLAAEPTIPATKTFTYDPVARTIE